MLIICRGGSDLLATFSLDDRSPRSGLVRPALARNRPRPLDLTCSDLSSTPRLPMRFTPPQLMPSVYPTAGVLDDAPAGIVLQVSAPRPN